MTDPTPTPTDAPAGDGPELGAGIEHLIQRIVSKDTVLSAEAEADHTLGTYGDQPAQCLQIKLGLFLLSAAANADMFRECCGDTAAGLRRLADILDDAALVDTEARRPAGPAPADGQEEPG